MKRKAIQLAKQTIVVSLPAKWVKQQGIKKGDEIDVEERGKELVIGTREINGEKEKGIEVDISNLNERVVRWTLGAFHKIYDEIVIKYNKPDSLKIVINLMKELFMGYAIIEQTENKCVLRCISKVSESEFDAILRRAFLVTLAISESSLEAIKKGKLKNMNELISLEHTNNQLTNFCQKILNKMRYKDYKKTSTIYTFVWNLEKVCDEYKYICEYLSQSENNKTKISKEVINLFEKVNNFIKSYYELFYKFDIAKLNDLSEERNEIEKEARRLYKTKIDKEIVVINYLLNVVMRASDFSASMILLNQQVL